MYSFDNLQTEMLCRYYYVAYRESLDISSNIL
jgi:hypothetical protein